MRPLRFAVSAQARSPLLTVAVVSVLCGFVGCTATTLVQPYAGSAPQTEVIFVISGGWHTELGLSLGAISGPLAALKPGFPGARYLVFGWGARDYYMANKADIGDLLRAAAPGPAVMLVIPLEIPAEAFFGASNVFVLPAAREGIQRLSEFVWDYLAVDKGRTWVKLSGAYADTKVGPPTYADSTAVAQAYVKAAPERLVWGSDWPHPGERENKPDDAVLFDLLLDWAPDETVRHRILVENPATLYDYPKSA